jgi:benzylsuccinate CoA-transferase BbsE subunit
VSSNPVAGPLTGLRVIELASEPAAYCGKLLADFGADVLLIEPVGGHPTRWYPPFAGDKPDPDGSLWFWHYNTSKQGLALDLDDPVAADQFRQLVAHTDIVLEAEPPGRLRSLGIDATDLLPGLDRLIWVSVTPFGRDNPCSSQPFTDLTVMSGGGMVWNCGYDDHALPPVRCEGNQGFQTAAIWAAIGALTAVHARETHGTGQLVDVSMHAAANVTTEQASHFWMVAKQVVQRQTGRHAAFRPTEPVINPDRDGNEVHTGFPPRAGRDVQALISWIDDLGLREEFGMVALLEIAVEAGGIDLARLQEDPLVQECYRAARAALAFIAAHLSGYEFFIQGQRRGLPVGVIYAPEEVMADPHMVDRGFPTAVFQPQLGRDVLHPGAPVRFQTTPWHLSRPAPRLADIAATPTHADSPRTEGT